MQEPLHIVPSDRRRGRGAASNRTGRFESEERHRVDDGWQPEDDPALRTEVRDERVRKIITYNRSPDLSFDRSINPYRGCEHGCIYCFARPSHAYLGFSPGLDFETRLIARPNAPEALVEELRKPGYKVAPIAIGTNTDPYQPIERNRRLMRGCLEVLADCRHPAAIVTKGALVERDIDILAPMAAEGLVRVGISVTTLDAQLARRMEPRCPPPKRRLEAIRALTSAGIEVRLMASPLVPGLSDHEAEAILEAGAEAGATLVSWSMLRLPLEVSELWQEWLHTHYPAKVNRVMGHLRKMHGGRDYDARWHHRMRGEGAYADIVAQRIKRATRALGLGTHGVPLRCDLFRRPKKPGDQLQLF